MIKNIYLSIIFVTFFLLGCSEDSSSSMNSLDSAIPYSSSIDSLIENSSSSIITQYMDTSLILSSSEVYSSESIILSSSSFIDSNFAIISSSEKINQEYSSSEFLEFSSSNNFLSSSLKNDLIKSSSSITQISSSLDIFQSSSSIEHLDFSFYKGADISTVQEYEKNNVKFYDIDGKESDIFTILKNHGFNAIRLRTFVSPLAKYGYAAKSSECNHLGDESYGDKNHIIAYAKKIKNAGMAFLLDIHYSDNWADPGKQIIPERWRQVNSSDALADSVYNYTFDLLISLKNESLLPDMVQIGNETTPGILIHVPNSKTDCWGNGVNKASESINGDMGTNLGKENAAKYFNAGIRAVKAVSSNIKTVLHIESIRKKETINWWMNEIFKNKKIQADIMGFSAYTAYGDGPSDNWMSLFNSLIDNYPNIEFIIAEYNGGDSDNHYNYDNSRNKMNKQIKGLNRFIGTFFWEPTLSGAWGSALFDWSGNSLKANKKAFEEFDFLN